MVFILVIDQPRTVQFIRCNAPFDVVALYVFCSIPGERNIPSVLLPLWSKIFNSLRQFPLTFAKHPYSGNRKMGSGYMDMIVPNVTNPLWPTQLYIIIGHVLEVFAFVDQHKPIVSVQRSFYGIAVIEVINSSIKIRLIIMIIDL